MYHYHNPFDSVLPNQEKWIAPGSIPGVGGMHFDILVFDYVSESRCLETRLMS